MEHAHFFIGIPVPSKEQEELELVQEQLKGKVSYKRWTHPEDMHITLKFLGGASTKVIEQLGNALEQDVLSIAFSLQVETLNYFGNPSQPRVMFVDVEKTESLAELQQQVEKVASKQGFPIEKRSYSPHITLAKKWQDNQRKLSMDLESIDYSSEIKVDHFHIYRIHPNKEPMYEIFKTIHLK
ncbi:RNA 2',3'-cyclic phosphodiesterase [Thalassobacillus hwangdonensis]|uniref:RNA 2',3'-cyclic phosphodiesterase n=1 Tax=Thalassobacillus hwangdonensis TaxID=546108 RepID=A0ABW3KZX1_9BACI